MKSKDILANLTLEQKAKLTVGKDFWHSFDFAEIRSLMLTDGPHGLRKQVGEADHLGLNESVQATCFPTASCLACSFDDDLLFEVGEGIAKECVALDVDVLLGPAVNIKRSPLGGRNFEYYSEDPLLSGRLGGNFIKGIERLGVGACVKHFACNNQEYARMVNNSIVDERTLFEIYLKPFELALKIGKPLAVMCSYNKINGIYAAENKFLLTDVLRNKWNYDGIVISDWGAVNDKVASIQAGLNLEMPASLSYVDVIDGINSGKLLEKDLNKAVLKLIEANLKLASPKVQVSTAYNHELARKAAAESMVLLKNQDNLLPLNKAEEVLLIGNLKMRIQGSGSSRVNSKQVDDVLTCFEKENCQFKYLNSFEENSIKVANKILFFLGLPEELENEGKDRSDLKLATADLELLKKITLLNSNVIVVLTTGSVVELPFINDIKGLLLTYLAGEAAAQALIDILYNKVNPSGRLAETWLKSLDDCYAKNFASNMHHSVYREGLFVGYRYYDKTNITPLFPFGYGLSYTCFEYRDIKIKNNNIYFKLKNTGNYFGKEVIELYVSYKDNQLLKPKKELKNYVKVGLNPLEEKEICFPINADYFEFYDLDSHDFVVSGGEYELLIGSSSWDIKLRIDYKVDAKEYHSINTNYNTFKNIDEITLNDFAKLYGKSPELIYVTKPYTINSTMAEIKNTFVGRILNYFGLKALKKRSKTKEEYEMSKNTFLTGPIRLMGMGLAKTNYQLAGIVKMLNGQLFKGLWQFLRKDKRVK